MTKVDLNRKLSDEDYRLLAGMLSRVLGGKVSNVEALDGFLTALVVGPDSVPPSEYIPTILSGETEDGDLVFESMNEAEEFYGILIRYWNQISRAFSEGGIYMPYLIEDEDGKIHGNDWAKGFLTGTHLRFDDWDEIVNDDERGGPFIPIMALAYEHADDPDLRPFNEAITEEKREQLVAGMIAAAKKLYDLFREHPKTIDDTGMRKPLLRQKVGRNDLCPCGSGKKFKKCCGLITFH